MEAGMRLEVNDGMEVGIYTVLEVDQVEGMCRLLNEGTGEETVEQLWPFEYMWDVTVL